MRAIMLSDEELDQVRGALAYAEEQFNNGISPLSWPDKPDMDPATERDALTRLMDRVKPADDLDPVVVGAAAFAMASLAVALDCTPGSDDDYAKDFGLALSPKCLESDPKHMDEVKICLADGRTVRVMATAEVI